MSSIFTEPSPPQSLHSRDALFERHRSHVFAIEPVCLFEALGYPKDALDHEESVPRSSIPRTDGNCDAGASSGRTTGKPQHGSDLRFEHIPVAQIDVLEKAIGR